MTNRICTVIIPAYQAEKTIGAALESLDLAGDHRYPIEVSVVDDGSSDDTRGIVSRFAAQSSAVHYCYKENGGVSAARNHGLRFVTTKYVFFLDADDLLIRDGLDAMIDIAERTCARCVIGSYYRCDVDSGTEKKVVCPLKSGGVLSGDTIKEEILRRYFNGKNTGLPNLWNKLYRTDVIRDNGLSFHEDMSHGEDWRFNIEFFQRAASVYVTDSPVLRYRVSGGTEYARYKKRLAYSLIEEFRIARELNETYRFCTEKDEDYLLFIRRALEKSLAFLRLTECTRKEKVHFLGSKEEQYLYQYLSRLSREELAFLDLSRKDRAAFWLIGHKMISFGMKLL